MTHSFRDTCTKIADSIRKIPFHWTSTWYTGGGATSVITTKGDLWATKVLTFNDDNLYGDTRQIEDLMYEEYVTDIKLEKTLRGPRLRVFTRHDV